MFFITLVAVILLPASVINSKPRSIERNISVPSTPLPLLPTRSLFLSFALPFVFPFVFFAILFSSSRVLAPVRQPSARRNRQADVIALAVTAKIKADCRARVMSCVRRGTDDSIIFELGNWKSHTFFVDRLDRIH